MSENASGVQGLELLVDEMEDFREWVGSGFQPETFEYRDHLANLAAGLLAMGIRTEPEVLALIQGEPMGRMEVLLAHTKLGSDYDVDELKIMIDIVSRDNEAKEFVLSALARASGHLDYDDAEDDVGEHDSSKQAHDEAEGQSGESIIAKQDGGSAPSNVIIVPRGRWRRTVTTVAVGMAALAASLAAVHLLFSEDTPEAPHVARVTFVDGTRERASFTEENMIVTVERGSFYVNEEEYLIAFTGDVEFDHQRELEEELNWKLAYDLGGQGDKHYTATTTALGTHIKLITTDPSKPFIIEVSEGEARIDGLGCAIKLFPGQDARLRQNYREILERGEHLCQIWLSDYQMSCNSEKLTCSVSSAKMSARAIVLQRAKEQLRARELDDAKSSFERAKELADASHDDQVANDAMQGLIDVAHEHLKDDRLVQAESQFVGVRKALDPVGPLFDQATMGLLQTISRIAGEYYERRELLAALAKYKEVKEIGGDRELGKLAEVKIIRILRELAEEYERTKQWVEAEAAYHEAMTMADDVGDEVSGEASARGLAKALEAQAIEIEDRRGIGTKAALEKYEQILELGERAGDNRADTARAYIRRYGSPD